MNKQSDPFKQEAPAQRRTPQRVIDLAKQLDALIQEEASEQAHELFFETSRRVMEERTDAVLARMMKKHAEERTRSIEARI